MMNYLRVVSDLHLEQYIGRDIDTLMIDFIPEDNRDNQSMLILAGDVSSKPEQLTAFLQRCLQRFENVLFVPGNHEFYGHHMLTWATKMKENVRQQCQGLFCPLNDVLTFENSGFEFHACTLWGDAGITPRDTSNVGRGLRDFYVIQTDEMSRRFTADDMRALHKKQKAELKERLRTAKLPSIVVTHHLPSRRLVADRFWPRDGSDGVNGGFVGECDDILAYEELAPKLWIHGHTHDRISTELWTTKIECNPFGYNFEYNFNTAGGEELFIELDSLR